ncbi:MAG: MAPEG family protein [Deltaproteobacteria bacterium]|nr:MAPEG family protein [Deltaproteobacteria bacterium]MBW2726038.1 MAPEG family protein [Deltaproteobacteria bacterium]
MEVTAIIIGLALIEYMVISYRVGAARGKYGVDAPATTGNEIFERHYRVQHNTIEQLVIFLPSIWVCTQYTSAQLAWVMGIAFIVGRAIYAVSYVADPAKRGTGFLITFIANTVLVLGGLFGAVRALL